MQAFVYKSLRKPDTYLYLRERDAFALLPEQVLAPMGRLEFVMELEVTPERKFARVDAQVLRSNLAGQGFHLQFPDTQLDPLVAGGVGDG
jgi:uncharacterized protein YcgL (UPF0745 family)